MGRAGWKTHEPHLVLQGSDGPVDPTDGHRCVGMLAFNRLERVYLHMYLLVALHGQPGWVAALTPRSVDGTIVASSTTLLVDSRSAKRGGFLPWSLLVIGSGSGRSAGLRQEAFGWAVAHRAPDGSLPSGKAIADQFGRHERWGRLVKQHRDLEPGAPVNPPPSQTFPFTLVPTSGGRGVQSSSRCTLLCASRPPGPWSRMMSVSQSNRVVPSCRRA
jgi:hypothetical protein